MRELTGHHTGKDFPPNVPACFYDLAAEDARQRKAREKEARVAARRPARRHAGSGGLAPGHELEADSGDHFDEDFVHGEEAEEEHGAAEEPLGDMDEGGAGQDWDDINPHLGGEVGPAVLEGLPDSEGSEGREETYEDLVAKRVAEFVQQTQQVVQSSALTQRVSAWHDMVRPRLDAVELRKAFDIHAYGSRILDSLPEPQQGEEAVRGENFNAIFGGEKREEVCRYFLSALMLANTSNVEILPCPALAIDQLRLSLLSTTRHHEQLTDFQAASQQGPASSRHQPKRPRGPDSPPGSPGEPGSPFRVPAPPKSKRGKKRN